MIIGEKRFMTGSETRKSHSGHIPFYLIWGIVLLLISVSQGVSLSFFAVIFVWSFMLMYALMNIKRTPMWCCFLVAFFVFLLGRQACFHYLHMEQVYDFLDETNDETYMYLLISLAGLGIGRLFVSSRIKTPNTLAKRPSFIERWNMGVEYQLACEVVFYFSIVCSFLALFMQIRYVRSVGYITSYSSEASGGAGIPTILWYCGKFMPAMLCLYLATKPSKRRTIPVLILYEVYGILQLFTGQRYPFVGISMFILIYYLMRSKGEKHWMTKFKSTLLIAGIPILLLFLTAYDSIRVGKTFSTESYFKSFADFFISQGGSVNTIRRTIYNAEELKDMTLVSFSSIRSAIFENAIGRRLFSVKIYSGNSLDKAMYSNILAHRLSYIAYGDAYLTGRGTGSSYIAELLRDFGGLGVFLGSVIYGSLIVKIDQIQFKDRLFDAIKLAMIYQLLFAPRGSFDMFIGGVFNFYTLLGFGLVFVLTAMFAQYTAPTKVVSYEK